jgi:hypothetical protein
MDINSIGSNVRALAIAMVTEENTAIVNGLNTYVP